MFTFRNPCFWIVLVECIFTWSLALVSLLRARRADYFYAKFITRGVTEEWTSRKDDVLMWNWMHPRLKWQHKVSTQKETSSYFRCCIFQTMHFKMVRSCQQRCLLPKSPTPSPSCLPVISMVLLYCYSRRDATLGVTWKMGWGLCAMVNVMHVIAVLLRSERLKVRRPMIFGGRVWNTKQFIFCGYGLWITC